MNDYQTILFPTDGSDSSNRAIEYGLDRIVEPETVVHVLYVVRPFQSLLHDPQSSERRSALEQTEVDLQEAAEVAIEEFVDRVRRKDETGIEIEHAIRHGIIPEEIVQYAADQDVELIVMGRSGHTVLDRFTLGSVTERVLRASGTPVLVI